MLLRAESSGLAHAHRLETLRTAAAGMRIAAFAAMRTLQRLLSAIVLPGVLLALRPLTVSLVAAVGGLSRLMALALPMSLLARLGTVRVLVLPVRSAMASSTVSASVRPAHVAAVRMIARFGTLRSRVRAVPIRFAMTPLMPGVWPAHVATVRMLAGRVAAAVLAMASVRPLRLTAAVLGRPAGAVTLRLASVSAAAALAGGSTATTTRAIGDMRGMKWMVGIDRDLLPDGPFDVAQKHALLCVAERDGDAVIAGARSAADAMDVALRLIRQVEIDHVGDAVDVDAASGDVGRHQDADLAVAEILQRLLSRVLGLVAVDGVGAHTGAVQLLRHLVGAVLGAGEDQRPPDCLVGQQVLQQRALVGLLDEMHALRNALGRRGNRRHLDAHRLLQQARNQAVDGLRHGGGEHQGLAFFRQLGDDTLHRHDETHVKHAVRLVEHEGFEAVEPHLALVHQVQQTTRRCHQHVEAARQVMHLRALADTAVYGGAAEPEMATIGAEGIEDLDAKLAGRRQDEDANAARTGAPIGGGQALQQRKGEGRGLAGSRLGDAKQVAAFEQRGNRLRLDRRRGLIAFGGERLQQGSAELQFGKGSHVLCSLSVHVQPRPLHRHKAKHERGSK